MAIENYTRLDRMLSSLASTSAILDYLKGLSLDEILIELSSVGINVMNKDFLKEILIRAAQADICDLRVRRSVEKTPKPITVDKFREHSIKIKKAYLDAFKTGNKQHILSVSNTLLIEIDKLQKWPRILGQEYPTVWLDQAKYQINKYVNASSNAKGVVTLVNKVEK